MKLGTYSDWDTPILRMTFCGVHAAAVVANEWVSYLRSYTLLECYTKESRTMSSRMRVGAEGPEFVPDNPSDQGPCWCGLRKTNV
jgi:hypothetical protein